MYLRGLVLAETLAMRPLVAHFHLGLGRLSGRNGNPARARVHLTTARTLFEMEMRHWLGLVEAEMTEPG